MIVNEIKFNSNTQISLDISNITSLSIRNLEGDTVNLNYLIDASNVDSDIVLTPLFTVLTATYIIKVDDKDYYITNLNIHNRCLLEGVLDAQIVDCEIVNTCEECHEDIFKVSLLLDTLNLYYLDYTQSVRILTELERICEDCVECKEPDFIATAQISVVNNQNVNNQIIVVE